MSLQALLPIWFNRQDGKFMVGSEYTVGGMADSYFEYLLKMWLLHQKQVIPFGPGLFPALLLRMFGSCLKVKSCWQESRSRCLPALLARSISVFDVDKSVMTVAPRDIAADYVNGNALKEGL
jgi:hypothetical protein